MIATIGTGYAASKFILRHLYNPTVLSIEKDFINWNTTFPSISLCPMDKLNETELQIFLRKSSDHHPNLTKLEQFIRGIFNIDLISIMQLEDYPLIEPKNYMKIFNKLTTHFDYTVETGLNQNFKLQRIVTDSGICYTFNSEISPYLTSEYLMDGQLIKNHDIYTVNYFDIRKFAQINNLHSCDVYIHGPYDFPRHSPTIHIDEYPATYTALQFDGVSITANPNIRDLLYRQRRCRFSDESNLPHFPTIYSYTLCIKECQLQSYVRWCGCVPFVFRPLPHEEVCNVDGMQCLVWFIDKIYRDMENCKCDRDCVDTKFTLKTSNSINWFSDTALRWELAEPKVRLKQEILFGKIEVLVTVGSTFGLFLGLSVLSIVETAYLYVMEFFNNWKRINKA